MYRLGGDNKGKIKLRITSFADDDTPDSKKKLMKSKTFDSRK